MNFFDKVLQFYIKSSIHVALAVMALVEVTHFKLHLVTNQQIAIFSFFGTIVGYNFVKYITLEPIKNAIMGSELKAIYGMTSLAFLVSFFVFFKLHFVSKIVAVLFLLLTILYAFPILPNKKNARNWSGVKIYIVALCWAGVTVILPVIDRHVPLTQTFFIVCVQRFILVYVLTLIFEIIDLKSDALYLQTVPQKMGLAKTKFLGGILLVVFWGLEFFNEQSNLKFILIEGIIALVVALFLLFANENRSKYYSIFWVESIPVLWWGVLFILN